MIGDEIKKVVVVGAGTMGLQISLISAGSGYEVSVYDSSENVLHKAVETHRLMADWAINTGKVESRSSEEIISRILYTSNAVAAAKNAYLLTESVPEQLELKHTILSRFEKLCPEQAILTTNTSSLLVTDIEPVLRRPEKFAAMHFHSGMTPLVDIMKGRKTSDETVESLKIFVRRIGLVPMVMKKEKDGYLFNTLLISHLSTALSLAARGYGTPQDIDRAWMMVTGQAYGPFGSMDAIGLDVSYHIIANPNVLDLPDRDEIKKYLQRYLDRGDLGEKTGRGFYIHPNPIYRQAGFLSEENS